MLKGGTESFVENPVRIFLRPQEIWHKLGGVFTWPLWREIGH